MPDLKICFVGLGSIGCRHIRNLSGLLASRHLSVQFDALRSSARTLPDDVEDMITQQFQSFQNLENDYDICFICDPTSQHYQTLLSMSGKSRHFFIEKPVFDRADLSIDLLHLHKDSTYYVACPLRYSAVLQNLKARLPEIHVYAARAICSTYLPDWRPGTDYRQCYSAHKSMGGGVSIDLVHEWDYLTWFFGFPQKIDYRFGQYSELEIDSDDIALYIGEYQDKLISLQLDYFGRFSRREIEIYTADDVILGDLTHGQLRWLHSGKALDLTEGRDKAQTRELEHFLDILEHKIPNDNTIENALSVLKLAQGKAL